MVLRLALDNGWKPRGTEPPPGFQPELEADGLTTRPWDPQNYFARKGQRVTDEDAAALAAALEQAMPDVPGHDAVGHKVVSLLDTSLAGRFRVLNPYKKVHPFEYFSGENKARLQRFIDFCKAGGFRIV
jgi:hypothetical protein